MSRSALICSLLGTPAGVEPQAFLGNLGLTGGTAYWGLLDAAQAAGQHFLYANLSNAQSKQEVLEAGRRSATRMGALLAGVVASLSSAG